MGRFILQDTTTFSYQRGHPEFIGYTGKTTLRTGKKRRGSATATHAMRHPAFESRRQHRRIATWPDGGEGVDEKVVQGGFGA
jgi:hypothetical protein